MGRHSRIHDLTEDEREKFASLLREGNFREAAAAAIGIPSKTLRDWIARAHTGEPVYSEFLEHLEQAEAVGETMLVKIIMASAASGNWIAAAWILERRGAKRWQINRSRAIGQRDDQIMARARTILDKKMGRAA